jgi:protein-L-isoaspartate O-methyltransferase
MNLHMRWPALLGNSLAVSWLAVLTAWPSSAQIHRGRNAPAPNAQNSPYTNKLAPYVSSPTRVVDRMLELADIKPGETVYDLGSGDGRVLIAAVEKYKAHAVGVEISPKLVVEAANNIQKAGIADQARVMQGDVMEADLNGADVVIIYLATSLNEKLRPRFEKFLKPGARVISHDYAVPGWKPTRVERTDDRHAHLIYVYEMPPVKN